MRKFLLFTLIIVAVNLNAQYVKEIPDPNLGDIAIATFHPSWGPVVLFNPLLCNSNLPFCTFSRAHEYAHHQLGHVQKTMFMNSVYNQQWIRANMELQADCSAARSVPRQISDAAIYVFLNQGNRRGSVNHPTGFQRVNNIRKCRGY